MPTTVNAAMKYAYITEGVKSFSEVNGVFSSPVQHSAARTKEILRRAQSFLIKHGSEVKLSIVAHSSGAAMHFIL